MERGFELAPSGQRPRYTTKLRDTYNKQLDIINFLNQRSGGDIEKRMTVLFPPLFFFFFIFYIRAQERRI